MINWDFTEKIFCSEDVTGVLSLVKEWSSHYGFTEFGFAAKFLNDMQKIDSSRVFTHTTHCSEWSTSYHQLKQSECVSRDARVQCSIRGIPAGAWNKDGKTSHKLMLEKLGISDTGSQLRKAGEYGLEAGILAPIQSRHSEWAFFGFSSYKKLSILELERNTMDVAYTAHVAYSAIERLFCNNNLKVKLSVRENEVLRWASIGKTSWEISVILNISERTVNFHLTEAAKRLGVKGRRAACTVAMVQGLLQFA